MDCKEQALNRDHYSNAANEYGKRAPHCVSGLQTCEKEESARYGDRKHIGWASDEHVARQKPDQKVRQMIFAVSEVSREKQKGHNGCGHGCTVPGNDELQKKRKKNRLLQLHAERQCGRSKKRGAREPDPDQRAKVKEIE